MATSRTPTIARDTSGTLRRSGFTPTSSTLVARAGDAPKSQNPPDRPGIGADMPIADPQDDQPVPPPSGDQPVVASVAGTASRHPLKG